jgi:hypothetical protein
VGDRPTLRTIGVTPPGPAAIFCYEGADVEGAGVSEPQQPRVLLRPHAEHLADEGDWELRRVRLDEVDALLASARSSSPSASSCTPPEGGDRAGGENPADEPSVAGVLRRLDDEHRRRVRGSEALRVAGPSQQAAYRRGQGRAVSSGPGRQSSLRSSFAQTAWLAVADAKRPSTRVPRARTCS